MATGAAGGGHQVSGAAAAPTGGVTLVPLDGPGGGAATTPDAKRTVSGGGSPSAAGTAPVGQAGPSGGADSGPSTATSPPPATTPAPPTPVGPARLSWSNPVRKPADKRWCEDVSLTFTNSGGTAVRSGTVTFGTHIIGLLGIDWGTVESAVALPVPIGTGARKERTWTVCVDAWRVPLGMHVETRDVTVRWK